MNERERILTMVSEGKLTVEEAEKLLDALKERGEDKAQPVELKDRRGRKPTKLRVLVDSNENSKKAKVNVAIPLSLVKTFGPVILKNLPREAKEELDKSGVDLAAMIRDMDGAIQEASEEDLVNIDSEGEDAAKVRIYLE
ncbi:SHOCT-like domain-containing protein [Papillibacter cinnamivorans]|uniref:YvlB/LiaX N-terminal domain-containing protein n=1 Tax=Papillibacter cinnamivorans DSM 12816 TaxID=1122930 RepID=A0A1W2CA11_9FIRM|nr:hypothetical protein [Papillibacter cinnamivorans]SMC81989.1 hypothetical protein SAMN02745168_2689 [Papillibacter cinnamivorans DSM 12816]